MILRYEVKRRERGLRKKKEKKIEDIWIECVDICGRIGKFLKFNLVFHGIPFLFFIFISR